MVALGRAFVLLAAVRAQIRQAMADLAMWFERGLADDLAVNDGLFDFGAVRHRATGHMYP